MNRRRAHLISLTVVFVSALSAAGFAGYTPLAQENKTLQPIAVDPVLKDIANYKHWTRVNDVPLPVTLSVMSIDTLASNFTSV